VGGLGGVGGGQTMKSVCLANVYQFRKYLNHTIDIVGCGGIESGRDVYDYLLVGAKCVQIGTQLGTEGPAIFKRLKDELIEIMQNKNNLTLSDIDKLECTVLQSSFY
jgi:dihydroorotate dehydrogenase (fumarate)